MILPVRSIHTRARIHTVPSYVCMFVCAQVPHLEMPPMPWRDGITLQDGVRVTPELHATLAHMLELMNRGIDTLPDLSHRLAHSRRRQ